MKKKKRISSKYRFCHRLGALFCVLIMSCLLIVPAFASNNASTSKWTIVDEALMKSESGVDSKYFKLSPYVGGSEYAHLFRCQWVSIEASFTETGARDVWIQPVNYPQLWRSSLPLGANSYVEISSLDIKSIYSNGQNVTSSYTGRFSINPFVPSELYTFTGSSPFSSAWSVSQQVSCLPYCCWYRTSNGEKVSTCSGIEISRGTTTIKLLQNCSSIRYGLTNFSSWVSGTESPGFQQYALADFYNAETSDLGFYIVPYDLVYNACISTVPANGYINCAAVVSYWVDANKLPAGLKVGDEFPANLDAFEDLQNELVELFPEVEDHIANDKATFEDLRDADTIDADTASSFFSLIGTFFSIPLVSTVALMCAGFAVILILLRKAMA